jgi:hypothetical protein
VYTITGITSGVPVGGDAVPSSRTSADGTPLNVTATSLSCPDTIVVETLPVESTLPVAFGPEYIVTTKVAGPGGTTSVQLQYSEVLGALGGLQPVTNVPPDGIEKTCGAPPLTTIEIDCVPAEM